MKKLFIVAVVASFGMVSCKKDYTCECTTTSGNSSITGTSTVNATKKDAKTACENGSTTNGSYTTTCKIK